jgi:hypothetical protein
MAALIVHRAVGGSPWKKTVGSGTNCRIRRPQLLQQHRFETWIIAQGTPPRWLTRWCFDLWSAASHYGCQSADDGGGTIKAGNFFISQDPCANLFNNFVLVALD